MPQTNQLASLDQRQEKVQMTLVLKRTHHAKRSDDKARLGALFLGSHSPLAVNQESFVCSQILARTAAGQPDLPKRALTQDPMFAEVLRAADISRTDFGSLVFSVAEYLLLTSQYRFTTADSTHRFHKLRNDY
jgi:hypothetical protein